MCGASGRKAATSEGPLALSILSVYYRAQWGGFLVTLNIGTLLTPIHSDTEFGDWSRIPGGPQYQEILNSPLLVATHRPLPSGSRSSNFKGGMLLVWLILLIQATSDESSVNLGTGPFPSGQCSPLWIKRRAGACAPLTTQQRPCAGVDSLGKARSDMSDTTGD